LCLATLESPMYGSCSRNRPRKADAHLRRASRRPPERSGRGTYTPYLHKVTLAWDVPDEAFVSRFLLLFTEATLYHEVGHHVCRHDFGQDPVQEREADEYASRLLKKAHHRLAWMLRMLRAGRPTGSPDWLADTSR